MQIFQWKPPVESEQSDCCFPFSGQHLLDKSTSSFLRSVLTQGCDLWEFVVTVSSVASFEPDIKIAELLTAQRKSFMQLLSNSRNKKNSLVLRFVAVIFFFKSTSFQDNLIIQLI